MRNFKKVIIEILHLFLGVIIISGLFYIRLLPRLARSLWEQMTYSQILITLSSIFIIILHIILFALQIKKLRNISKETPKGETKVIFNYLKIIQLAAPIYSWCNKKLKFFVNIFLNCRKYLGWVLENIYEFVWFIIEKTVQYFTGNNRFHYMVMRKLSLGLLAINKYLVFGLLLSIKCIPKLVFVLAFCYDVFYCKQLNYTFKCIPWLLLPLLEDVILFIFRHFYTSHWESLSSIVVETKTETGLSSYFFIEKYAKNPPWFVDNFQDFFDNHLMVLVKISDFFEYYYNVKYIIFPYNYFILTMAITRLIVFTYILIYGIT